MKITLIYLSKHHSTLQFGTTTSRSGSAHTYTTIVVTRCAAVQSAIAPFFFFFFGLFALLAKVHDFHRTPSTAGSKIYTTKMQGSLLKQRCVHRECKSQHTPTTAESRTCNCKKAQLFTEAEVFPQSENVITS